MTEIIAHFQKDSSQLSSISNSSKTGESKYGGGGRVTEKTESFFFNQNVEAFLLMSEVCFLTLSLTYYAKTSGSKAEEPIPASDDSRSGLSPHLLSGRCAPHRCRTRGSSPASRRRRRNRCRGWWCSRPTGCVEWWGWMLPPWGNHPPAPSWLPPPWIEGSATG